MEESEAVEKLKNMRLFMQITDKNSEHKFAEDDYNANEIAIQALRDIQQYREVGTVDECREANGKQMPKKVKEDGYFGFVDYVCPTCGHDAGSSGTNYCKNCGQKLRWR